MDSTYKHILVVLCIFLDVSVHGLDCIFKECFCIDSTINCMARGLGKMPPMMPSSTHYTSLSLDMNGITDIPAGSLPPNLTEIFLDENPTTTIAESAFDSSRSTLEILTFDMAEFTRIPDALRHLNALKLLKIRNSNIQDWNEEAMMNIGQTVETLDIENVGMTSWPSWLNYFSRLTELTVTQGSISSIPDDAFDNVTFTLKTLTLESNKLSTVPKALSNCAVLQELHIEDNKIVDITWLPRESQMVTLSLSNNMISDANQLSNSVYRFRESLQNLNLDSNRLSAIPNISFLTYVESLDFYNNRLSNPFSGSMAPTVRTVDFSNNFLPSIPRVMATLHLVQQISLSSNSITQIHASDILASTTIVYLGNNLITELSENCFPFNSSMTSLQLNNNPISTISIKAFQNLVHLVYLNLEGTRLTRLPLALSSLTSLYVLYMSFNDNLVCTCQERSLQPFIQRIPDVNVSGKCGLVGIYDFFVNFSPLCPTERDISHRR